MILRGMNAVGIILAQICLHTLQCAYRLKETTVARDVMLCSCQIQDVRVAVMHLSADYIKKNTAVTDVIFYAPRVIRVHRESTS